MSVRLLTTALALLMQAGGQKPADLPQNVTITCTPAEGVLFNSHGAVIDLLTQVVGVPQFHQEEDQSQTDVFPLQRLADDDPRWEISLVGYQVYQAPRWDAQQIGLSMLRQMCPPLRFCPLCQMENDPCTQFMGCLLKKCGTFWGNAFAQAESPCQEECPHTPASYQPSSPCNQGCPYYHPRSYPSYSCPEQELTEEEESQPIEDCSAAVMEELEVQPREAACDDCTCCPAKCGSASKCAKTTKIDRSCCAGESECCEACACTDCGKNSKCACADGKCGCKDGACSCAKSVKLKKACGECGKTFKTKFENKCSCKGCKDGKCACGECGCQDGACSCAKAIKLKKKAQGDRRTNVMQAAKLSCGDCGNKTNFENKCACKGCKDGKCACGECGCQDGACTCGKSEVKYECPHLKAVQARAQAKVEIKTVVEATPLENLIKITRARALFHKAEKLHQAGAVELAAHCYAKAQKLAPGSRYDGLAQTALASIQEAKAVAKLPLLERARQALRDGNHDEAYQLAEQAYGEAYTVLSQANALLRVIDAERYTDITDVEESEPTTCDPPVSDEPCEYEPLPCMPGCVLEGLPIAVEVLVAEHLEAAQRALAAGCFSEAQTFATMALTLDPRCGAAQYLADKASTMVGFEEEQEEPDACYPESGDEPCEIDHEVRIYPLMPAIDPAIAAVLQEILNRPEQRGPDRRLNVMMAPKLRVEEQDVAGAEEEAEPRDWQIIDLYIDPNECDGYMPNFEGTEATEPPLADAGNAFRQLVEAMSGSCIEVDTGCHGPRVWIQLGAAHCHWSMQGAATVSFTSTSSDDDVHPCTAGQEIKVDGPCQIRIHLNWKGLDCSGEVEPCEPECDLDPCDG